MAQYTPDFWALIKVNDDVAQYRLLSTFLGVDDINTWKINSHIVSVSVDADTYTFVDADGDEYLVEASTYGTSGNTTSALDSILSIASNLELMEEPSDITAIEWTQS